MNDWALYADALLFMTSLSAALFCLRLQMRLKALQRLDKGLGGSIKALAQSVDASRGAVGEIRGELQDMMDHIDDRYGSMKLKRQEIEDVLDTMDGQVGLHIRRCHEARQLTEQALTPLLQKAEVEIQALTKALEISTRMAGIQSKLEEVDAMQAQAQTQVQREPKLRSSLRGDREEQVDLSNPFLRAVGE